MVQSIFSRQKMSWICNVLLVLISSWHLMSVLLVVRPMNTRNKQWNEPIAGRFVLGISGKKMKKREEKHDSIRRHFLLSSRELSMMISEPNRQSLSSLSILLEWLSVDSQSGRVKKTCIEYSMYLLLSFLKINPTTSWVSGLQRISSNE